MAVGLLDVDLDEGSGQFLLFPRRACLAGAKTDDDVLPSRRLAGTKRDVLDDAVSLVEDAEDCNALRHRRDAVLAGRSRCDLAHPRPRRAGLLATLAAGGKRKPDQQQASLAKHLYSGIQGS